MAREESAESSTLTYDRVLVTGASGFIGTRVLRSLVESGVPEIHAVSRGERASGDGVTWWRGDLDDPGTAERLVSRVRPELIIHLAAELTRSRDLSVVPATVQRIVCASIDLLAAATRHGCRRVLIAGSLEEPDAGEPAGSPYGAAKLAAREYARFFHRVYATPVVWTRIFMTYGPGQQNLSRLVPYVTLQLLQGNAPALGSGKRLVDWVYIDDVAQGLLTAASTPGIEGQTVDLGTGALVSVRDLVEQLVELTSAPVQPAYGSLPDPPFERVTRADVERTRAVLGWRPAISLKEGLGRTVEWYRMLAQGTGVHLLMGGLYSRLESVAELFALAA